MSGVGSGVHAPLLRLCLDLNVFVADLLSRRARDRRSAASFLVEAVREGHCPVGPVQLVVSLGMLDRLQSVLMTRPGADADVVQRVVDGVAAIAANGPSWDAPYLVLGGVGVVPVRDVEDRGVLEVAVAGRAHLLVTSNLQDFVIGPSRASFMSEDVLAYDRPHGYLIITTPGIAARWLRSGMFPHGRSRVGGSRRKWQTARRFPKFGREAANAGFDQKRTGRFGIAIGPPRDIGD